MFTLFIPINERREWGASRVGAPPPAAKPDPRLSQGYQSLLPEATPVCPQ